MRIALVFLIVVVVGGGSLGVSNRVLHQFEFFRISLGGICTSPYVLQNGSEDVGKEVFPASVDGCYGHLIFYRTM